MLTHKDVEIDGAWWRSQIQRAWDYRRSMTLDATAFRVAHAEGDGLPSLIVDQYGEYTVVQLLSAGLEAVREEVITAVEDVLQPTGILLRNDVSVRRHEGLPLEVVDAVGTVPDVVEVREGRVVHHACPRSGQKTGAFLDQRTNRLHLAAMARGRALDLFTYQGLFALHLASGADRVMAVDSSGPALTVAQQNAALNHRSNIEWVQANVFELLRELERAGERFDIIVVDPPAFAKQKDAVPRAVRAYKEINLRAAHLLTPGGVLLTCSCSFHLNRSLFVHMLADAAADARRSLILEALIGQSPDHPEVLTIPETGYLKGALLRAR
jgi:23S rRNA (cytosine1962-C5)-methyltransferase